MCNSISLLLSKLFRIAVRDGNLFLFKLFLMGKISHLSANHKLNFVVCAALLLSLQFQHQCWKFPNYYGDKKLNQIETRLTSLAVGNVFNLIFLSNISQFKALKYCNSVKYFKNQNHPHLMKKHFYQQLSNCCWIPLILAFANVTYKPIKNDNKILYFVFQKKKQPSTMRSLRYQYLQ